MSDDELIDVTDILPDEEEDVNISSSDNKDDVNNRKKASNKDARTSYFNKQQFDRLKDTLNKKKEKWLNAEGFADFARGSIFGIIVLTIYFYFGVNFNLLSKNAQANPGGLMGQDMNGAPYAGNYSQCSESKINLTQPMTEWSFPYKNPITCDASANKNRPLHFRFLTWSLSVLAFSYSMGRTILNVFLSGTNDTANILLGPVMMLVILSMSFFVGWSTSIVGSFANIDKLLPKCYFSFWFPIITFCLFLIGVFVYPTNIALLQFFTVLFYLFFYASTTSMKIVEDGVEKTTKGFISILTRILSNSTYLLLVLTIVAVNALNYLGIVFATPILGWIGFYVFTRYLTFILS